VHDSNLVDTWIDLNYEHQFLVLLREKSVGGPLASMLSVESPALTIFGAMSTELIRMANELAELSGFPVIVRPLEEDPSPHFMWVKHIDVFIHNTHVCNWWQELQTIHTFYHS
jgi:hypothetical protein